MAFVQNVNATFIRQPQTASVQITTGTGSSALVTVYTGSSNGSKVPSLIATGVGTTNAFDVQIGITTSAVFYMLGTVTVPAGAGSTNSIASVNCMNMTGLTLDSDGNPFIFLGSSLYALQAKAPATSSTWAAGAVINLIAPSVGDF